MNPINELREDFLQYGKFELSFDSVNSLWSCSFVLGGSESFNFHKTNLEDVLEELRIVLTKFRSTYKPEYVK